MAPGDPQAGGTVERALTLVPNLLHSFVCSSAPLFIYSFIHPSTHTYILVSDAGLVLKHLAHLFKPQSTFRVKWRSL